MAAVAGVDVFLPPRAFLQLAGHPLRWELLRELGRSDRRVHELTRILGEPQNLVSYHLRKLRDAGVVRARRSSADGRDAYYSVALDRIRRELAGAGAALHPGVRLDATPPAAGAIGASVRVLFLCTGNSARSQMAEALAGERSGGLVEARSAGSHPKPLHPEAVRVMRERFGIDLSGHRSKHVSEVVGERFDRVITLCDRVREVCPELPGDPHASHWSIADPASEPTGSSVDPFERTAEELDERIGFLLTALATTPDTDPKEDR
jgi:protein-tyrosine-phosphatase